MMTDIDKISKAVTSITANHPLYKDIWICDESWVRIVNMHFKDLKDIKNMRDIIKKRLNKAAGAFDEFNAQNIYVTKFQTNCPYETNKRRPVSYYYFGTGRVPHQPTVAADVECAMVHKFKSFSATHNRQRNKPQQKSLPGTSQKRNKKRNNNSTNTTPRRSQRNKQTVPSVTVTPMRFNVDEDEGEGDSGSATGGRAVYWSSPEAAALFGFNYSANDDVVDLLEKVIEKLDNAIEHFIGSLSIPPTQQSKKQFILHQIRPESSGCNRARVLCNI